MTDLSKLSDAELLSMYAMPALTAQESGGRGNAVSPQGAQGSTQMLPATAQAMAQRAGLPWRPDFMTSTSPEAIQYQQTLGRSYLQQGIETTGNLSDGLRYYHGGPDRKQWGPKTQAYEHSVMGRMGQGDPAPDLSQMSDQQLMAMYHGAGQDAPPPAPAAVPVPQLGPGVTMERADAPRQPPPELRADQGLGFLKGSTAPVFNASGHLQRAIEGSAMGDSMAEQGAGLRKVLPKGLVDFIDNPQGYYDAQAAKGVRPGKIGEFAGNVAGTSFIPGGPLMQGAVGGALLSDKKDLAGVAGDAGVGAVAGRLGAAGSDALQLGARKLLSKAPKIMDLPGLKTAVSDAYKKVDASGFSFPKSDIKGMADDFANTVKSSALSKSAKDDANSIISYARTAAADDLSLSKLEKLRGDIYDAMVKKGGDTARVGTQFRTKIDSMIDAIDNGSVRAARDLNSRYKKADFVDRMSKSADIRAEKDYGGDYGRKVKDRMFPAIDPANPNRNMRGATPDEVKALTKVATGTKTQNLASALGGMTDPRRMGGKILASTLTGVTGATGMATGGASIPATVALQAAQLATGFGLTGVSSKIARKNVRGLADLVAAGGSKEALKKVPTKASYLAEVLLSKGVRPAVVASAVPALVAARKPETPKARPAK